MKQIFWAAILTLLLWVLGVLGDNTFGMDNATWKTTESVINFPGILVLKLAGPGHGFRQLVLPFLFSLAFYFCVFWWLMVLLQKLGRRQGQRRMSP